MDANGSATTVNPENSPDSHTENITSEQMCEAWTQAVERADERAAKDLAEWSEARKAAKAQLK